MQAEESAAVIGWTLETFGTPFVNWLKGKAQDEKWKRFDWPKAEQVYLDKVIDLYDRVRILGNSIDVPLGNIFTQVYILDKPTARQRYDIDELRKQAYDRLEFQRQLGRRTPGMALVKGQQNLFILGKPGAGKTTFLKYIAVQAARKQLPQIPIFVSLNQWADSKWGKGENSALLPFMIEQFDICNFPEADLFVDYLLREGRALLLFDGLDEVKQEQKQRRRLTNLLQDFARKYSRAKHLITCRIAASDYVFEGFVDVEVADFTPEQIHEYAKNWFSEHKKKFDAFVVELAKPENKGLAELCNTPLLLSLLCLTFDNDMRFPLTRAELYEDALESLLRKWDSSRQIQRDEIYRALSYKRKLQLLMRIALPTFQKSELFFRQRDLEKRIVDYMTTIPGAPSADMIDGTAILKTIEAQHSILIERAQGIYSFSHLTFQEYLAARYLAENQGKEGIDKLIYPHITDKRWREVFLLTSNLLGDGNEFINAMRRSIDAIIGDNLALNALLIWACDRTNHANSSTERCVLIRLAYIFLALARSRERNPSRDLTNVLDHTFALSLILDPNLTHDLARSRNLALDLARSLAFASARSLAMDLALMLDLAKSRAMGQDRAFVRSLAHTITPLVGFDYGIYYIWGYATLFASEQLDFPSKDWAIAMQQLPSMVREVARCASSIGQTVLARQLANRSIPLVNSNALSWRQYADVLLTIMRSQRALGREWKFSDIEISFLSDYFYANELLVQCLKVATVSDRQTVLQGLLLPPEAGQGDKKIGSQEETKGDQP